MFRLVRVLDLFRDVTMCQRSARVLTPGNLAWTSDSPQQHNEFQDIFLPQNLRVPSDDNRFISKFCFNLVLIPLTFLLTLN